MVLICIIIFVSLQSCVARKDSPAPGCIENLFFPSMGGCFGRSVILDIQVEPEIDCLLVEADNCNGGVLDIKNSCEEDFLLDEYRIESSSRMTFDVEEMQDGNFSLIETDINFSVYIPENDTIIILDGLIMDRQVKITYTKTKALCE